MIEGKTKSEFEYKVRDDIGDDLILSNLLRRSLLLENGSIEVPTIDDAFIIESVAERILGEEQFNDYIKYLDKKGIANKKVLNDDMVSLLTSIRQVKN